jgi:hypothetical protein
VILEEPKMAITLDHQIAREFCNHCQQALTVSRGSVFEDNNPIGIFLAAMHACDSDRLVHLAIAVRKGYKSAPETTAIALKVRPTSAEIQMSVVNAEESSWKTEEYLGRLMNREEALASPLIESFFHIADHIVAEIPEVRSYLADGVQPGDA